MDTLFGHEHDDLYFQFLFIFFTSFTLLHKTTIKEDLPNIESENTNQDTRCSSIKTQTTLYF